MRKNFNMHVNQVIAVQNYGCSGTVFTQSLLDNHSQVISLPFLCGLRLYGMWNRNLATIEKPTVTDIKKVILKHMPMLFDANMYSNENSMRQLGVNRDQRLEVKEDEFFRYIEAYFKRIQGIKRRDFIISIYFAWNQCFRKEFTDHCYLCFPIHSQPLKVAQQLTEDFEVVKFLHLVRNPISNIGSLMKHIDAGQMKASLFKSIVTCSISQILYRRSMHWTQHYSTTYCKVPYLKDSKGITSRYIRLEDLHLKPEYTIRKVIAWLDINEEPCLYESTFQGLLWHNRSESIQVSGFNKKIISQSYDRYLNSFDRYRLKILGKRECTYFKYQHYFSVDYLFLILMPLLSVLPFKGEFNVRRAKGRFKFIKKKNKRKTVRFLLKLNMLWYKPIFNYVGLRALLLRIWFSQITSSDTRDYVKPL